MKSFTHSLVVFAAVAMAQIAGAEPLGYFHAPFSFRTPSGAMAAGRYEMQVISTGNPMVLLRHQATNKRKIFGIARGEVGKHEVSRLDFVCVEEENCLLERIVIRGNSYINMMRHHRQDERRFTVLIGREHKTSGD